MVNKENKIFVAGHRGMVGSAITKTLKDSGYKNLILVSSKDLDLRKQKEVDDFFKKHRPDIVIDAAARVGGILANSQYPYNFLMENLQIQNNLIDGSVNNDVSKFIFLGSSCIYPKMANQPLKEDYLLTNELEPTNQWYAIAKIAGVKACEAVREQYGKDYISLMPTNLYGENDNFDLKTSHVLPAMIRKFDEAKENNHSSVKLWGSGSPKREFLHVKDLASAVQFSLENRLDENLYNVGSGVDISIKNLAETIQGIIGHKGEIFWDSSKPDGTPRKLMDTKKMSDQGWKYSIDLEDGIKSTYEWYLKNKSKIRKVKL
ncbi:MAG TPA: GDP-L-fucose synthase [Mesonia sp.]|nr:GDP-L-fucose synthase [Mesonia sp.]